MYYIYKCLAGIRPSNFPDGKIPKEYENISLEEYEK